MRKVFGLGLFAVLVLSLLSVSVLAQTLQNTEVHGYIQNRFYAPESGTARFAVERVSLSTVSKIGDDGNVYVEIYFHPWITDKVLPNGTTAESSRTYVESAYVDLPVGAGRIRLGKGRQLNFGLTPSYPNRKTSQYGILSETFTQDRIVGAQYAYKKGTFEFGTTLFTDQNVGTRSVGDYPNSASSDVVKHVSDRDVTGDMSGRLAVSAKVGWNTPKYQFHLSGATGKLNPNQLSTLNSASAFNTPTNSNTDHNKYGADLVYSQGKFVAQAEAYEGDFSFLKISGWQALVGYQPKDSRRFYVRYSALHNSFPGGLNTVGNQLSWDVQQLTFGLVQPIRKGIWAELEYEKNMERTTAGASDVKNDLLFLEVFSGF